MISLEAIGERAKKAAYALKECKCKNEALISVADALEKRADEILAANAIDIENAKAKGIAQGLVDRLLLTSARIDGIVEGILAQSFGEQVKIDLIARGSKYKNKIR